MVLAALAGREAEPLHRAVRRVGDEVLVLARRRRRDRRRRRLAPRGCHVGGGGHRRLCLLLLLLLLLLCLLRLRLRLLLFGFAPAEAAHAAGVPGLVVLPQHLHVAAEARLRQRVAHLRLEPLAAALELPAG